MESSLSSSAMLSQRLIQHGLDLPTYSFIELHNKNHYHYECVCDVPELHLTESSTAQSPFKAKEMSTLKVMDKITQLRLLPQ